LVVSIAVVTLLPAPPIVLRSTVAKAAHVVVGRTTSNAATPVCCCTAAVEADAAEVCGCCEHPGSASASNAASPTPSCVREDNLLGRATVGMAGNPYTLIDKNKEMERRMEHSYLSSTSTLD
jgi:hypothetical protein